MKKILVTFVLFLCIQIINIYAQKGVLISVSSNAITLNNKCFLTPQTSSAFLIKKFGKPDRVMDLESYGKALIYDSLGITIRINAADKFQQLIIRYNNWFGVHVPFYSKKPFNGTIILKGQVISDLTRAKSFIKILPNSVLRMSKYWDNFSLIYGSFRISANYNFNNMVYNQSIMEPMNLLTFTVNETDFVTQKFEVYEGTILLNGKPAASMGYEDYSKFDFPNESYQTIIGSDADIEEIKIQDSLYSTFHRNIEEGIAICRKNSVKKEIMNKLGYKFLYEKFLQESIAVFKLNIELHPNYANGYDSAAEAFLYNEDFDLAAEYYKKSNTMKPNPNSLFYYEVITGCFFKE